MKTLYLTFLALLFAAAGAFAQDQPAKFTNGMDYDQHETLTLIFTTRHMVTNTGRPTGRLGLNTGKIILIIKLSRDWIR